MKHNSLLLTIFGALVALLAGCSSYDDLPELCDFSVELAYSDSLMSPYAGARVEARGRTTGTFVDSTDAHGVAHFRLTPGVYEIASSGQQRIEGWRLFANGSRSNVVVQPESTNRLLLLMTVTKRKTSN